MSFEKVVLDREVEDIYDFLVENRRHFHENPESSLKEFETAKYIRNILDDLEIEYESVGETGTIAKIVGNKKDNNKTIFLRADIDALELPDKKEVEYKSKKEGLHHACGHDGHASALLGAAKILNSRKDEFSGTIKLGFQQAEEIGAGARQFVEKGILDDVDFAFGIHLSSDTDLGKIVATKGKANASCDIFEIKVKGKSAHAACPHFGHDAAIATASILVELQSLISRQKNPNDSAIISIGEMHSGTRYNVIAGDGYLKGTLRTFDNDLRKELLEKIEKVAKLTAEIHQCSVEFSNYNASNPLINYDEETEFVQNVAKDIVSEEDVVKNRIAGLGAEDFADYLQVARGCFARVGSRSDENTAHPQHSDLFDIDERALLISTQLHVNVALDFLNK